MSVSLSFFDSARAVPVISRSDLDCFRPLPRKVNPKLQVTVITGFCAPCPPLPWLFLPRFGIPISHSLPEVETDSLPQRTIATARGALLNS